MPFIQLQDKQIPLRVGAMRVGSAPDADIALPSADGASGPEQAVVDVAPDNHVTIRRANGTSVVRVNGVRLGAEPTPLIHGDKIEIAGQELLFADDRQGGRTQFIASSSLPAEAVRAARAKQATATTGGRLISLVDGREYTVVADGLSIGRDASCQVVVPSSEVSRLHAEIAPEPRGYVIRDLSTNGVWVNGVRVDDSQLLGRADIIRVGNEEFRFYADVVPAAKPAEITAAAPPLVVSPAARATPAATATVAPPAPVAPIAPSAPPKPRAQPAAPLPPVTPPPAPRPVLATLEIVSEGVLKGKRYEIRVPLVHIGRGPHNDVVVFDDSVSDAHAKLQKRDAGWFVVDMASTNGTYVAGQRVTGEQQLHGAPDIRVGGVKLVFHPTPESADQGKGTRAIAGMSAEQAQRMRAASAAPRTASVEGDAPATNGVSRGGVPAWIWIAVVVVVAAAAAAFFLFQSR